MRDKAKATVMVYVEYEGVPSAASFATDKKSDFNNEDGERDDGTIQTTNVSLEDDFKAMRHFNVKRPNDRQKNWKKTETTGREKTGVGTRPVATGTKILGSV